MANQNPFPPVEPWPEPVNGAELINGIAAWISCYVHMPQAASFAVALWTMTTWFLDEVYFAPILTVVSPTKRAGKSFLLDLISRIAYRGRFTSGFGVTPAAVFRLNEQYHPTLIIDEAEKLQRDNGGSELISLLNAGHRRGGKVQRCEKSNGSKWNVEEFDAFGFRAAGLIGEPRDTLIDRSIMIRLQRKPQHVTVRRMNPAEVESEASEFARKIAWWVEENRGSMQVALADCARPDWLNDRDCDNWSGCFAVADVAGGDCPQRALQASQFLSQSPGEDGDLGERLIQDIRNIFVELGNPEAIGSGDLVNRLNEIETSPWGDIRSLGVSPHYLARLIRPFDLRPRQGRDASGTKIRGYWLADLEKVFDRYPAPPEVGQVGQWDKQTTSEETVPLVPLVPGSGTQEEGGDECSL